MRIPSRTYLKDDTLFLTFPVILGLGLYCWSKEGVTIITQLISLICPTVFENPILLVPLIIHPKTKTPSSFSKNGVLGDCFMDRPFGSENVRCSAFGVRQLAVRLLKADGYSLYLYEAKLKQFI
jgi:hypothetical protein